jgi:hypothetical protein
MALSLKNPPIPNLLVFQMKPNSLMNQTLFFLFFLRSRDLLKMSSSQ